MITIIVYTLNDQQTIGACLQSLVSQHSESGHEVVVIDDGSSDETAAIVAGEFAQYQLLREEHTVGWVASLREHLPGFRGDVLAFLGAHCQAEAGWLASIEREIAQGEPVITGSGHHGKHGFLERFQAISVHGDYMGQTEGEVPFLWDDNFAIRPDLLRKALPQTEVPLSDGAGAVLLSRNLHKMGIPIAYRPSPVIDHSTHSLGQMFAMWYGEMAVNSVAMKRADPSAPGAGLLRLGPIVAAALAAKRWLQGVVSMSRARHSLSISHPELVLHVGLLTLMMPAYFAGLCRAWFLSR
jgi:cellulose synthase/poly-beta-1,6-N-acetylglucosamine synthase-like glycosyltransferase